MTRSRREGENEIELKMVRPRDETKLTPGIREPSGYRGTHFNTTDWVVALADRVP